MTVWYEETGWPGDFLPFTIYVLLFVLIARFIYLTARKKTGDELTDKDKQIISKIAIAMCAVTTIVIVALLISAAVGTTKISEQQVYSDVSVPIASLADTSGTTGSFVLGCGQIRDDIYYMYYEGVDPGPFTIRRINADGVRIFTDEDVSPYILFRTVTTVHKLKNGSKTEAGRVKITEIHVPRNTIRKNFNLDSEV